MLGQHVINDSAVFVALGLAIGCQHRIDRIHQGGAIGKAQFFHKEIIFVELKIEYTNKINKSYINKYKNNWVQLQPKKYII